MRCVIATVMMVLASCGANSAIEIVIGMPEASNIDEVKLYVGLGFTQNMDGSTPERLIPADYPRHGEQPRGFWWKRDTALPDGDRLTVEPGTKEVRFVFQPGTHDHMTVIVVGYSNKTVVAAALLEEARMESGTVRQYVVNLAPASPATPGMPRVGTTVQDWGPEPDDRECAHYRDGEHSVFVVNLGDHDCDGFKEGEEDPAKNLECRPDVYRGFKRAPRNALACITKESLPPLSPSGAIVEAAVLGGPGCVDGRGIGTCDVGTVCIDEDLYGCFARADALDCAANVPTMNTSVLRVACTFYYATEQVGGPAYCDTTASLGSDKLPPSAAQLSCDGASEYLFWTLGSGKWSANVIANNTINFTASKPTTSCLFELTAGGTPQRALVKSLLTVQLANKRAVALPVGITVEEVSDCDSGGLPASCKLEPSIAIDINSAFARCMRTDIVDPW